MATARDTAADLVADGVRVRACWDLGAVARLLHGISRDDPGASWAAAHGLDLPPLSDGELTLLDLAGESDDAAAVRADGQLSREWIRMFTVNLEFVVQMRPSGKASAADKPKHVTLLDFATHLKSVGKLV